MQLETVGMTEINFMFGGKSFGHSWWPTVPRLHEEVALSQDEVGYRSVQPNDDPEIMVYFRVERVVWIQGAANLMLAVSDQQGHDSRVKHQ